jgi:hypothetical protein
MQIQRNALRRQLHRAAAFGGHRERRRRESRRAAHELVEVALGGKEKRVAGERGGQQAGRNSPCF